MQLQRETFGTWWCARHLVIPSAAEPWLNGSQLSSALPLPFVAAINGGPWPCFIKYRGQSPWWIELSIHQIIRGPTLLSPANKWGRLLRPPPVVDVTPPSPECLSQRLLYVSRGRALICPWPMPCAGWQGRISHGHRVSIQSIRVQSKKPRYLWNCHQVVSP